MNSKVSILMGIFNCSRTLDESIQSIIKQTYNNWELIMCDDGSIDNTLEIAEKYAVHYPNKIIVLRNIENKGLAYTLNQCLKHATGIYIARQDGDDISLPNRLEVQVEFLESNPQYSIVSTGMILFDEKGEWGEKKNVETPRKLDYIKETPFAHAPSVMKKAAIESVGGYRSIQWTLRVEDYDLWFRMREKGYVGYNLQKSLYLVRDDRDAISRRKLKFRINETLVKIDGYKRLKIPVYKYIYSLRPILVGLIPVRFYSILRRRRHQN